MHSVPQLWLTWKSSIKNKSLNTKQCTAGLSPRIIRQVSPFLPKLSKKCSTLQVWTVLHPSLEPLWEILGMGKNPTRQPKLYSFLPSEKSALIDLILSLSKVSFLAQIAIFKYATFICSLAILCFKFQALCTHVVLIWLINVCWMLPLAWQKHWMIEAIPSKLCIPSTFLFSPSIQCYFKNPASIIACFPLFRTPCFISNYIKFQLTPHKLGFPGLWPNQI